ncbi:TlpA disulfide reductase family protein [uncultured Chitinophaga sp.]|uniref:TlpA disulfide reductase family protein n=1 Tax=uncultured Chitinophaga sp. TaxID=339340 RepID=UPI0025D615D8|nr:TlpA disulfide reductase family protein [uncultured Chitinophaga sp.]
MFQQLFLAAAIAAPGALFAQSFTIKGYADSIDAPAKVYLYYVQDGKPVRDSAAVVKGVYNIKGKVDEPVSGYLTLVKGPGIKETYADRLTFYIEGGTINIKSGTVMSGATVTAGATNKAHADLKQRMALINKKRKEVSADANKEARAAKMDALEAERKAVQAAFIKSHPNTIVSMDVIKDYVGFMPAAHDISPLFNSLSPGVKNSKQGKLYAANIAKLQKSDVGELAPLFEKADTSGVTLKLTDFRGKYVLIDFWASWCKPCRAENPHLRKVYAAFKDKNFEILGVSLDVERGRSAWLKAIADDQLTWPQVIDLGEEKASDLYSVMAIPQNFLVGPDGKIIARNLNGEALDLKLAEVLK